MPGDGGVLLFGFTGPLTIYYLPEILRRFGGGMEVKLPARAPADAMTSYVDDAVQLGPLGRRPTL